ncbi:DNA repair protein RadA homolog [Desulfamplus magnetovallimortis]|uniref:DNA repair protein RadA n=1 Tax=Desulfamplus magnetovallimortis TaxID=1246637 RepID=A0A1W1HGD7_9BACT|nr:DNA repair protein RadA [Desulfamplus magnetovallimortis]SLM31483.1 DNA repair protein RadA homolog [Desulfamplus magnetovallimortis]
MKKKEKMIFRCQSCGHQTLQWMGKCPGCSDWDTLVAEKIENSPAAGAKFSRPRSAPVPMDAITFDEEPRMSTQIAEFDRVLGGGIVAGTLILIGGDPGIGKSTLMLQVLSRIAEQGKKALYVSGEESIRQLKMRGMRLSSGASTMLVAAETDLDTIISMAESEKPHVMVVDSIQTVYNPEMASTPGSVNQIREASIRLMNMAKQSGIPLFLVGHVTKVGAIAGPRIMEHMVDTVLYFEGDRSHVFRILRAVKNRFGSTNEIGVFEMKEKGLQEVPNPSAVFLEERSVNAPGSVVTASMEGTRPILIEIQGLASSSGFGNPRRTVLGLDPNRVALIAAVMEKRLGINLSGLDIFMNVTGGVKVVEPAVDLGVAVALASSFLDIPVPEGTTVIGEIGLTGEIRAAGHVEARIKEAAKMGFARCIVPANSLKQLPAMKDIIIEGTTSLKHVMETLFP